MARERAGAGARRVHQNPVELAAERQRVRRVELDEMAHWQPQPLELAAMARRRCACRSAATTVPVFPGGADQRRSLSSGRGAEIEHAVALANAEQQRNRLRRLILNRNFPRAKRWRARPGFRRSRQTRISAARPVRRAGRIFRASRMISSRWSMACSAQLSRGVRLFASSSAIVCASPKRASHRSTIHVGCECKIASRSAGESIRAADISPAGILLPGAILRSTALTSEAADDFRACFTSSTDSFTAARAGILSRKRSW